VRRRSTVPAEEKNTGENVEIQTTILCPNYFGNLLRMGTYKEILELEGR